MAVSETDTLLNVSDTDSDTDSDTASLLFSAFSYSLAGILCIGGGGHEVFGSDGPAQTLFSCSSGFQVSFWAGC